MIVRYESWGAWIRLERKAALVAIDRDGARALGLDGGDAWKAAATANASAPLEVHLAVTSRCAAGCEGCYLDARPDGVEPPREVILRAFDALREAGVFTVAFGGGEPTLRDDLGDLADEARARGLVPVVTTSGLGLGDRKIANLTRFAQVNVSYDGSREDYTRVRGFDGADAAERAIARLAAAGVRVGVNVVLTRATFPRIPDTVRRASELGAREAQLLRYKPAGRALGIDYFAKRLSPEQARGVPDLLRALAREHGEKMGIRIDCALVPYLACDPDILARPEELARWGVFGCEAGGALAATRVDGRVSPCSFAEPSELHISRLREGWAGDPTLSSFRSFSDAPPEPCASCTLRSVCKGGCKIVSSYVGRGSGAPDPECPRVRAHAAS